MQGQTPLPLSASLFSLIGPSDIDENSHTLMHWQQHNLAVKLLAELCNSITRFI